MVEQSIAVNNVKHTELLNLLWLLIEIHDPGFDAQSLFEHSYAFRASIDRQYTAISMQVEHSVVADPCPQLKNALPIQIQPQALQMLQTRDIVLLICRRQELRVELPVPGNSKPRQARARAMAKRIYVLFCQRNESRVLMSGNSGTEVQMWNALFIPDWPRHLYLARRSYAL